MTKEQIEAKMKEREEFIVSILKEDPKSTITGKSIDDAVGITASNRVMYMRKLMKKYPQIQNVGKKEAEYKWVEDAPVKIKNHEGYPDPTAQKAIAAVCKPVEIPEIGTDLKPKRPKRETLVYRKDPQPQAGEVWSATESSGSKTKLYILSENEGVTECIKLYMLDDYRDTIPDHLAIKVYMGTYDLIGNLANITSKPTKYLDQCIKKANEAILGEVQKVVAKVLKLPEKEVVKEIKVEVPVEKIVYKEKDDACWVENEKLKKRITELMEQMAQMMHGEPVPAPENYIDCRTAELAILTEQRDIWKTVALKLLEKGGL